MGKNIKKIVGYISYDIAKEHNIIEYANKEIVQSLDLYVHTVKHIKEFESVDNYNETLFNLEKIIANPFYTYYDKNRKSLLYFKEINEYVCVVVKLNLRKNKDTYVATVYPVSKKKVDKYKQRAIYEKYIIVDE